jgi:ACT domain-containing protein
MSRQFLTAEDVSRASGSEILVDTSTVVTPQALEAATAAGISIRTEQGPWSEPAPDRGPDSLGRHSHLPEPEDNPQLASSAVVTAVGINRPGVLAELTAAIAERGANVHDVSQKVVDGYFHMILTVELGQVASFEAFKTELECMGTKDDFAVRVMNERVFRFMHRV